MTESVGPPQLPDYTFDRELGRGGMGTVYLYRHAITQRPEVVKLLSPEVLEKPGNRGRFEREIRAAFRLSHPNIVAAYSTHRLGDSLAFCMEYVEGDDLMRLVQRVGPLPPGEACAYVVQACYGLQHAYEQGMVHRDIKPGNLMRSVVNGRAVVKVVDFGLAKLGGDHGTASDTHLTQYGQVLGTPDFIAPEQIRNTSAADIRADLYSLGCTLYFLLSGRPPFKGESLFDLFEMHIHADPPNLDTVCHGLPAGLADVVGWMMAKDPARRPQTPLDAVERLDAFAIHGTRSSATLPVLTVAADPGSAVGSAPTPSQSQTPEPEHLHETINATDSPSGDFSDRTSRDRLAWAKPTAPAKPPSWGVAMAVVAILLGVVAVLAYLLGGGPHNLIDPESPPTTPATASGDSTQATATGVSPTTKATTSKSTTPTPTTKRTTTPTHGNPTSPSVPPWFTKLFGSRDPAVKQTVWPGGDGWRLRDGVLAADDVADNRLALFDLPPFGDFDLTAEVVVRGGAGLLVRGDLRASGLQPTGYLIGLGPADAKSPAFEFGAVHRWGVKNGANKPLAAAMPGWYRPDRAVTVRVTARGDRVKVKIDDRGDFEFVDASGYAGGRLGLVTTDGGRITVNSLAAERLAPPPAVALTQLPEFTTLLTPDRLAGWEAEDDDRVWEMVGSNLIGRHVNNNSATLGHLLSKDGYTNFVLRFDCLIKSEATALINLRAMPGEKADFFRGEVRTTLPFHPCLRLVTGNDDTRPRPGDLERWFGSRISWAPVRGQAVLNPLTAEAWHTVEVRVEGKTVAVVIDGQPVNYGKYKPDPKLVDAKYIAGSERKSGRIGFCPLDGEVQFRNVFVKPL